MSGYQEILATEDIAMHINTMLEESHKSIHDQNTQIHINMIIGRIDNMVDQLMALRKD